jgi:Xaa-Pro aminopeptidase
MRKPTLAVGTLLVAATLAGADPLVPASEYAARRARMAQALGPNSMLILNSAEVARRNGDVEWPYRQDDNLYYLTGITGQDTVLVLIPGEKELSEILFVRDRNPQTEVWDGKIPSQEEVKAASGIRHVASNTRFEQFLGSALQGGAWTPAMGPGGPTGPSTPDFSDAVFRGDATLWFVFERRPGLNAELPPTLEYANKIRARFPEVKIRDARTIFIDNRMVKSEAEVALLRRAIDITTEAQKSAMKRAKTATNEREIYANVEHTFLDRGACCWGFPSIVAAGANTTTLHYNANNAPVRREDLVLTDIGADYQGYTADVTRTYPADGVFNPEQRAIYEAVHRAQEVVFKNIKPGVMWRDLQAKATESLGADLLALGLIAKNEPPQVRMYFLHGLGHAIGLQVHDVQRGPKPLEPGNVMAVEPGIYVRKDDVLNNPTYKRLTADEQKSIAAALDRYANIGVRIEDNVVVTKDGYELLSAAAPRSVEAIEALMR